MSKFCPLLLLVALPLIAQRGTPVRAQSILNTSLASQEQPPSLDTILNDANYSFNRYQELAQPAKCSKLPVGLQNTCRDLINAGERNLSFTKAVLVRASKASDPSTLDLFEIYAELQEVSGNLSWLGDQFNAFSDDNTSALAFVDSGVQALKLSAHLGNEIKKRLLLRCH